MALAGLVIFIVFTSILWLILWLFAVAPGKYDSDNHIQNKYIAYSIQKTLFCISNKDNKNCVKSHYFSKQKNNLYQLNTYSKSTKMVGLYVNQQNPLRVTFVTNMTGNYKDYYFSTIMPLEEPVAQKNVSFIECIDFIDNFKNSNSDWSIIVNGDKNYTKYSCNTFFNNRISFIKN